MNFTIRIFGQCIPITISKPKYPVAFGRHIIYLFLQYRYVNIYTSLQ